MTHAIENIRLPDHRFAPVNRPRLARYLELPSVAQIDPITDAEICRLDERRDELLSLRQQAVVAPIAKVHGPLIGLTCGAPPLEATRAYGQQLLDSGADAIVVGALTIGGRVDEIIRAHLDRQEVYEAFVLKQWAATMTEQARAQLTRSVRAWAEARGRSLLPFDGPGYNGWPLASLHPLLELVFARDDRDDWDDASRPIRATDAGVLLPTNSMLIVHGLTCRRDAPPRYDERLAQCHRCAMQNCSYRVAPFALADFV